MADEGYGEMPANEETPVQPSGTAVESTNEQPRWGTSTYDETNMVAGDDNGEQPNASASHWEEEEEEEEQQQQDEPQQAEPAPLGNDLPDFANAENRSLNRKLLQREAKLETVNKGTKENTERVKVMLEHLHNVEQEVTHTQGFLMAKRKEAKTETHLKQLAQREAGRVKTEITKISGTKEEITDHLSQVQNEIFRINEKVDEFKVAMNWNQEEMEQWALAARQKEEDNLAIERYTRADEAKIKELNLQIQKLTVHAHAKARDLEHEVTETQAKQIELDKTAEEFRSLHLERQELVKRWQDAIAMLKKRDDEIQESGQQFALVLGETEKIASHLNAEKNRLETLEQDKIEMDERSQAADRALQKKRSELMNLKRDQETVKNSVDLLKVELHDAVNNVEMKKARNETLRTQINVQQTKLERARSRFQIAKTRLEQQKDQTLSVEELAKVNEDEIKSKEQQVRVALSQLETLKEDMFKAGQELFQLRQQESNLQAEISGAQASNKNLATQIRRLDEESLHQQELVYTAEFQIQQLERKVARASGVRSDDEKKQLNLRIMECKEALSQVQTQNSMLLTQMKKLTDDLRKSRRRSQDMETEKVDITSRVARLELEASSSEICLKSTIQEREEALVKHDILRLEVRRLKEQLANKADNVFGLENRKHQLEMSMQERKREIEVHRNVQRAKAKTAEEERRRLSLELNKRRTKLTKLKAKYETVCSSDSFDDDGKERSQAYYVIAAAQAREELQREGDELDAAIRKLQREIKALTITLEKLNRRNTKHRENFHIVDENAPQVQEMKQIDSTITQAKSKMIEKRKELQRLEKELDEDKQKIKQTQDQMKQLEVHLEQLLNSKMQVGKELEEHTNVFEDLEETVTTAGIEHRVQLSLPEDEQTDAENMFYVESLHETCDNVLHTISQLAKEFPELQEKLPSLLHAFGIDD